jgi:hypothetical protein
LDPSQAHNIDRLEDMLKAIEKEMDEICEEQLKFIKERLSQIEFIEVVYPQAFKAKDHLVQAYLIKSKITLLIRMEISTITMLSLKE